MEREKKQDVGVSGGRLLVGPGKKMLDNIYENKAFAYSPTFIFAAALFLVQQILIT